MRQNYFFITLLFLLLAPVANAMTDFKSNKELCGYFPSSVQSWEGNSNNFFLSIVEPPLVSTITNAEDDKVGFTNKVIEQYNNPYTPKNQMISSRCNGKPCVLGGKMATPYTENFSAPTHLVAIEDFIQSPSLPEKTFTKSSYFKSSHGVMWDAFIVETGAKVIFERGEYWFNGGVNVAKGAEIIISGEAIFHINGTLSVGGKVLTDKDNNNSQLVVFSYSDKGCLPPQSIPQGPPDIFDDYQKVIIGTDETYNIFEGSIYAQGVAQLSKNAEIIGSITACQLKMNNQSKITGAKLKSCNVENEIQLVIEPSKGKGLACDGITVTFSLRDSQGLLIEGDNQIITVTSEAAKRKSEYACWSVDGSISTNECNKSEYSSFSAVFEAGKPAEITRYIHSRFLNDYNIEASLNSPKQTVSAGLYEFVAESLAIYTSNGVDGKNNQQIAGREFPFEIHIKGKQNGNVLKCKTANVTATKTIDFSQNILPSSATSLLQIWNKGRWHNANQQLDIDFYDGIAGNGTGGLLKARYFDAGIVTMRTELVSSDVEGSTDLYFRPFTMAVCDGLQPLPSHTVADNGAYIAAGRDFNGYIKAVNWVSSLDLNNDGKPDKHDAVKVCQQSFTPSYISYSDYSAKAKLSAKLAYPLSGGVLGDLNVGDLDTAMSSYDNYSKDLKLSNQNQPTIFNWNEVGSLSLGAYQDDYLNRAGFNIPMTMVTVGRFYPAYFTITKTEWDYPDAQGSVNGSYAYMGQGFDTDIAVTAYSYNDMKTLNYGLFSDQLKAGFLMSGDRKDRLNISANDLDAQYWNGAIWQTPDFSNHLIWSRKDAMPSAGNKATVADGPFNMIGNLNSITTNLGLTIDGVDPVTFAKNDSTQESLLLEQPDVRYGRMVLDSIGTRVGNDVTIPLKVEYWSGTNFALSSTDNASKFDGSKYCKQAIWPNSVQNMAQLSGTGKVTQGKNITTVIANASSSTVREQVRFWLRIAETSAQQNEPFVECKASYIQQPWLHYNWRGKGDEDPSTVVTFGVYRGNDRILFRSESRIIGDSD